MMSSEQNEDQKGVVATEPDLTIGAPLLSSVVWQSKTSASMDAELDSDADLEVLSETESQSTSPPGNFMEGSECAIQTLYEGPPKCECCKNWVEEYPDDLRMAIEEQQQMKNKALIVRMRKNHGEGKSLVLDSIVIQSASLKRTLGEVFEGYQGITASLMKLVFRSPFHPFYYRWKALKQVLQCQNGEDPEAAAYTQLLHDVLHSELRDVMTEIDDLTSHRVITYPLLWALFEPGVRVLTLKNGHPTRFFIVDDCAYNHEKGYFGIKVKFVDWDRHRFGYDRTMLVICGYSGTMAVDELNVLPVSFYLSGQETEKNAIARGRQFVQLRGYHYVAYNGAFRHKVKEDGVVRQVCRGNIARAIHAVVNC